MRTWFSRVVALLFVLSLVASPAAGVMATDPATPVDQPELSSGQDDGGDSANQDDAGTNDDGSSDDISNTGEDANSISDPEEDSGADSEGSSDVGEEAIDDEATDETGSQPDDQSLDDSENAEEGLETNGDSEESAEDEATDESGSQPADQSSDDPDTAEEGLETDGEVEGDSGADGEVSADDTELNGDEGTDETEGDSERQDDEEKTDTTSDQTDSESESANDDEEEQTDESSEDSEKLGPLSTTEDDLVKPLAVSGSYTITSFAYDADAEEIVARIDFGDDFGAVNGDLLYVYLGADDDGYADLASGVVSNVSTDLPVVLAGQYGYEITISFTADQSGGGFVEFRIGVTLSWDSCYPASNDYLRQITLELYFGGSYNDAQEVTVVAETVCPGVSAPYLDYVDYAVGQQMLFLYVVFPLPLVAGEQLTINYPDDIVLVSPGSTPFTMWSNLLNAELPIGEITAADGLITLTLTRSGNDEDFEGWVEIALPASLTVGCEPGGVEYLEVGWIEFTSGEILFERYIPGILCNAAAPTKVGEWLEDEHGPYILWTIDTGDLFGGGYGAYVYDPGSVNGNYYFDCSSLEIMPAYEGIVWVPQDWGDENGCYAPSGEGLDFGGRLIGADVVRAQITIRAYPSGDEEGEAYLNCIFTNANPPYQGPLKAMASTGSGWGGEACYELYLAGDGDFISKTVDKPEARSGETVTFSIEVSTSSARWGSILLSDVLPAGFTLDPDSVVCAVNDVVHQNDPCFVVSDGVIYVSAVPGEELVNDEYGEWIEVFASPVTMNLTFSGTVAGEAGDVITNEACSLREEGNYRIVPNSMGDPTIPGGGVICDTANVTIIADPPVAPEPEPEPIDPEPEPEPIDPDPVPVDPDPVDPDPVDPDPSPTGTVIPGQTETPSPTATSTATVEPTATATSVATEAATSAVTGLPDTGNNGGGSGVQHVLMVAMAASVMMLAALGIRLKSTRE